MKIALAGFSQGYYAVRYLRYLSRLKGIKISGICDCGETDAYVLQCAFITAGAFAQELGTTLFHDYTALLETKPDAVLICSETCRHAEMAAASLARNIHTFVSKPLCLSSEDISRLQKTKPSGVVLLCGNPLKYEIALEELKTRLEQGEIGEVYSIRIMVNHMAMTSQEWECDPDRSGGPLGTYGVYLFDIARWLTGQPVSGLYAMGHNYVTPEIDVPDTVKVLAKLKNGGQCCLELYAGIRHEYPFLQVEAMGTSGTLVTDYGNYAWIRQTMDGCRLGPLRTSDMGGAEMEHFLACIRDGVPERCSLDDMDYVVRCIDATRTGMISGGYISVKEGEHI